MRWRNSSSESFWLRLLSAADSVVKITRGRGPIQSPLLRANKIWLDEELLRIDRSGRGRTSKCLKCLGRDASLTVAGDLGSFSNFSSDRLPRLS
jgi:hypothetical protein